MVFNFDCLLFGPCPIWTDIICVVVRCTFGNVYHYITILNINQDDPFDLVEHFAVEVDADIGLHIFRAVVEYLRR